MNHTGKTRMEEPRRATNQLGRGSDNQTQLSVLRVLRDLVPTRTLTFHEALQRAEVQAARLLALQGVTEPGVPTDIVTSLPKIEVQLERDMPVSGSTHWENGRWLVRLNEFDQPTRQRFSLLHEYKHILDHPFGRYIDSARVNERLLNHPQLAERVANHFAACVLMPKAWVKSAFCTQTQNLSELAEMFDVSPKAMHYRLTGLGLLVPARCSLPTMVVGTTDVPSVSSSTFGARFRPRYVNRYYRQLSTGFLPSDLLLAPFILREGVAA